MIKPPSFFAIHYSIRRVKFIFMHMLMRTLNNLATYPIFIFCEMGIMIKKINKNFFSILYTPRQRREKKQKRHLFSSANTRQTFSKKHPHPILNKFVRWEYGSLKLKISSSTLNNTLNAKNSFATSKKTVCCNGIHICSYIEYGCEWTGYDHLNIFISRFTYGPHLTMDFYFKIFRFFFLKLKVKRDFCV